MSRRRSVGHSWSGIRSILSHSLNRVAVGPDDFLDLVSIRWALLVGKEIAEVTKVNQVTQKTLTIDVAAKDWLPALKALHEKIIVEMRQQEGCGKLTRILFKVEPFSQRAGLSDSSVDKSATLQTRNQATLRDH